MKKIVLFLFLIVTTSNLFGQIDFNKVIPKTPEAAALIEKVDNPVNEYTGIPSIGIPIYTVQEGSISLPISLSYNAGGIKVSEEASTVGLGWSLNAGGSITRSLGGIDDFIAYFDGNNTMPDLPLMPEGHFDPDANAVLNSSSTCTFLVNNSPTTFPYNTTVDYLYDNNPDNFYYNFNGHSGSFVLDRNAKPVLNKREGIDITLNSLSPNQSTWTVIAEDGTIYRFEKRQQTKVPSIPGNRGNYYSSWFLTQIVGINGEIIDLIYRPQNEVTDLEPLRSFVQSYMVIGELSPTIAGSAGYANSRGLKTFIDGVYLSEILFTNGKVKFNYSPNDTREDMRGSYSLNSIQVFSTLNNIEKEIKNFDFNYSYFGNSSNPTSFLNVENGDYSGTIAPFNQNQSINARLRLDAVTENNIKTHSFEYNKSPLGLYTSPNKTTFAQDYWGYYNGERNEHYFIPASQNVPGQANRAPKEDFAKTFSLKKITYPTKGYTEFDYELNTYRATSTAYTPPVGTVLKSKRLSNGTEDPLDLELQFTTGNVQPNSIAQYKIHLPIYSYDHNAISQIPSNYGGVGDIYGKLEGDYILTTGTSNPDFTYSYYSPDGATPSRENGIILKSNTTYTLKVRFNKLNGALYGQAWIQVDWLEVDDISSTNPKQYSQGGGLRIKELRNFDSDNNPLTKRTYNYHYNELVNGEMTEKSYGKLKSVPNFRVDNYHLIGSYDPGGTMFTCDRKLFPECLSGIPMNTSVLRPTVIASAGSSNSYSTDFGSYIGYDQISVFDEDFTGNKNGKTIFKFYNSEDMFRVSNYVNNINDLTTYPPIRIPTNGLLYEKEVYKNEGQSYKLVHKLENKYEINDEDATTYNLQDLYINPPNYVLAGSLNVPSTPSAALIICDNMRFIFYPYYSHLLQQTSSKETIFDLNGNNPVVTEQKSYYNKDTHLQKIRIETIDSDNLTLETKIYYPDDLEDRYDLAEGGELTTTEYFQIDKLKADDLHRIATPIQTVIKRDGQILSIQRNLFSPKNGIVLPSVTEVSKGTDPLEERLLYKEYENGKPIHISKKDGPDISYIWGYNNQYPIAKIENLAYSSIPTSTINDLKTKSNLDNDRTIGTTGNEGLLRTVLNNLRNSFPQAMITTFTYDPIIGVTSITDPKGYTAYYDYDELQRLKFVKDQDGNLISENKYHYKD